MIAALLTAVGLYGAPCAADYVPATYTRALRTAVQRYWPVAMQPVWCWWVAQTYHESAMRPAAVSPAGALGLTQVLPPTGREQLSRLGLRCSLLDPACNIVVGTAYSGRMMRAFVSLRSVWDLLCWEAVAYNAGLGSALNAQRVGRTENCDAALRVLPAVTGAYAAETQTYVRRIRRTFYRLLGV